MLVGEVRSIPLKASLLTNNNLKDKVAQILDLKKQNPSADTADLEAQIDQLVYARYELTEEEIRIAF